jgi:hypothetical protein
VGCCLSQTCIQLPVAEAASIAGLLLLQACYTAACCPAAAAAPVTDHPTLLCTLLYKVANNSWAALYER